MNEGQKQKQFDAIIFKVWADSPHYDEVRHNLTRARDIMCQRHVSFKRISAKRQYDYCLTIVLISVQSVTKHIKTNMPLSKPSSEVFEYALEEGFKKVEPIEISIQKRLK